MRKIAMKLSLISIFFFGLFGSQNNVAFAKENSQALASAANPERILNIAHRGASGHAPEHTPEHTLLAYKLGEKMKGHYIEIDLQMTKDGHLIAMHDETLDRTTNGTGFVKDHTLAEIKQLDAGSWFNEKYPDKAKSEYVGLKVPTLEEIFETFGMGSRYYIETKSPHLYPGMEEKLMRLLKKYRMLGKNSHSSKVLLQSFSKESLLKLRKLHPQAPLIQLISGSGKAEITDEELQHIRSYAIGIGINYKRIDKEFIHQVRANHLLIHPYTVNNRSDMEKLLDWGVNGMFTNFPDVLHDVIKKR